MYWRGKGINIFPYLGDLIFLVAGFDACHRMAHMVEEAMHLSGLTNHQFGEK